MPSKELADKLTKEQWDMLEMIEDATVAYIMEFIRPQLDEINAREGLTDDEKYELKMKVAEDFVADDYKMLYPKALAMRDWRHEQERKEGKRKD